MSWLTKYLIDPIERAISSSPEASAAASATVANAKSTLESATASLSPVLDELAGTVETAADTYLAKTGAAGAVAAPLVDVGVHLAASAIASAVNAKFGKTVLTVSA